MYRFSYNIYTCCMFWFILWEKTRVENALKNRNATCFQVMYGKSGLDSRSIAHTMKLEKKKSAMQVSQSNGVNGFTKIHMLLLLSSSATIIDHPDSANGTVKETSFIRLAVIVMSATTASTFCNNESQFN